MSNEAPGISNENQAISNKTPETNDKVSKNKTKLTAQNENANHAPVITVPDPRLRQISTAVTEIDDEVRDIIRQMIAASREWEQAHEYELSAALAAPQLGFNRRIIVVREDLNDKNNDNFIALINPEIIKTEGRILRDYEGCLSVPTIYGKVPRPSKARFKVTLEDGSEAKIKAEGFLARTILHEIDHLNGILFIDHIRDKKDAFYRLNEKGDIVPIGDYENKVKNNKDLWPDL